MKTPSTNTVFYTIKRYEQMIKKESDLCEGSKFETLKKLYSDIHETFEDEQRTIETWMAAQRMGLICEAPKTPMCEKVWKAENRLAAEEISAQF